MEIVDAAGKLGTLAVALAVFFSTRAQNRWANGVSARAAQVEDQKFRLALLDRRSVAVEHVASAVLKFWQDGAIRGDSIRALAEAATIAELVFDERERVIIRKLLDHAWNWQRLDGRIRTYVDRGNAEEAARYVARIEQLDQLEDEMMKGFDPLLASLRAATRVESTPPLVLPQRRLTGWRFWRSLD